MLISGRQRKVWHLNIWTPPLRRGRGWQGPNKIIWPIFLPLQTISRGNFFLVKKILDTPHPWPPAGGREKGDSEEAGLLKTVAPGGPWHSEEKSEEALMTNPNFGPNRRQSELGLRSWDREEKLRRPPWPGPSLGPKCRRHAWARSSAGYLSNLATRFQKFHFW